MVDHIHKTLFINLESRPDRLVHCQLQLASVGLKNVERFNAVKLANGRIGCSMSHLKCLKRAKEENWPNVLICEDDIVFHNLEIFKNSLSKFFDKFAPSSDQRPWDVLVLGGNCIPPYVKYGDYCIKLSFCQTTTGYVVNRHYYDTLIENYNEGIKQLLKNPENHVEYAIDKYWIQLQQRDRWFMPIPCTVAQQENYSDIENQVTNYSYLMTDYNKIEYLQSIGKQLIKYDRSNIVALGVENNEIGKIFSADPEVSLVVIIVNIPSHVPPTHTSNSSLGRIWT